MALNKIFRSETFMKEDGRKYYIDIIPVGDTLLNNPIIETFSSKAFETKFTQKTSLSDSLFGMNKPQSFELEIDLMELTDELNQVINEPFAIVNLTMPQVYPTFNQIPEFKSTNLWIVKSDDGDSNLTEANYNTVFMGGVNYTPEIEYNISFSEQSQIINIILVDLSRLVLESIVPEYISFYFQNLYATGLDKTDYYEFNELFDHVYLNDISNGSVLNVKEADLSGNGVNNVTTVTTLIDGDKVLVTDNSDFSIYILQVIIINSQVTFNIINNTADISSKYVIDNFPDLVIVIDGTYANKRYIVKRKPTPPEMIMGQFTLQEDLTNDTRHILVTNKAFHNNSNFVLFKLFQINEAIKNRADLIIEKFARQVGFSITVPTDHLYSHITFYSPSQASRDCVINATIPANSLSFVGFYSYKNKLIDGFLYPNEVNEKKYLFEYKNMWDFLDTIGKSNGSVIQTTYNGNTIELNHYSFCGKTADARTISKSDIYGESIKFRKNSKLIREATINIDVEEPNKTEFSIEKMGSYVNNDYSQKAVFHTMPIAYPNEKDDNKLIKFDRNDNYSADFNYGVYFVDYRTLYFITTFGHIAEESAYRPHLSNSYTDGIGVSNNIVSYTLLPNKNVQRFTYSLSLYHQGKGSIILNSAKYLLDLFSRKNPIDLTLGLNENFFDIKSGDVFNITINDFSIKSINFQTQTKALVYKTNTNRSKGIIQASFYLRGF